VPPTNNISVNGILKFSNSGTIYQRSYVSMDRNVVDIIPPKSYLKSGDLWLGNSTYKLYFGVP